MAANGGRASAQISANLRQSVSAARQLSFAMAGVSGQFSGAVNASAALAENIAKASRNAKIAASATGIGAIVAILATVVSFAVNWSAETKEVAQRVRDIKNETAQLAAQAKGDKRLERELQIQAAMEGELDALKKIEGRTRKFPELQDAIRRKAQAARDVLDADVAKAERERRRSSFEDPFFNLATDTGLFYGSTQGARGLGERRAKANRASALRDLSPDLTRDEERQLRSQIEDRFKAEMAALEYELDAPARQLGESLGRSITGGIADGIATAIRNRSFGDGFKAITGSILIGFGEMLQEIGTQSLLAAKLLQGLIAAFRAFAPEGAIAQSLALIAMGGILKGIGASIGASGGGGGGGTGRIVNSNPITGGLVSVGPAAAAGGASALSSAGPTFNHFTVIGANDPVAQREILRLVDKGNARRGR